MIRHKESMSCSYIFPSTSRCPGNYIQEGVGQVTITIEGVVSTTKCDVAEIPACRDAKSQVNNRNHTKLVN